METIQKAIGIRDVTWLIKVHPAERILGTQESLEKVIEKKYSKLPEHIKIIPAESDLNTYGLLPILDGGVTIRGTVGLELAMLGKPVILAGSAHYGSKGFTYDCETKVKYFEALHRARFISKLTDRQVQIAKLYAYIFFIQKQIPFKWLTGGGYGEDEELRFNLSSFSELKQESDSIMDMICDRILKGGDFLLDDAMFYNNKRSISYHQASLKNPDQQIVLGERLYKRGDLSGALDQFLKALELDKNSSASHNNLGVCYWKLGDFFKALNHFSEALEKGYDTSIIENCNQIFKSIDKISSQREWSLIYKIFYLMSLENPQR
jgi:tetratricopeptide (TPR) repeat protein